MGATSAGTARAEYPFFRAAEKLDGAAPAKSVARNGANSPLHVYIKQSIGEYHIHRCFVQFRGGFVPASISLSQAVFHFCRSYLLFCETFFGMLRT